jgi:hypothetical protein
MQRIWDSLVDWARGIGGSIAELALFSILVAAAILIFAGLRRVVSLRIVFLGQDVTTQLILVVALVAVLAAFTGLQCLVLPSRCWWAPGL